MAEPADITQLLQEWHQGNRQAYDELFPLVYRELHRLSASYLRAEQRGHTLQPTALIHEAYLRLSRGATPECASRSHFIGIAARVMRQILVEHARARGAAKRTPPPPPEGAAYGSFDGSMEDVLQLHDSLERLGKVDERKARMIELHYFGGLTLPEMAEYMELSVPTVVRDLRFAKAWLTREMKSCQTPT